MAALIRQQLAAYGGSDGIEELGRVVEVGDGVFRVAGLDGCLMGEMLDLGEGQVGLALDLEEDAIGGVILGDGLSVMEGGEVRRSHHVLSVPVGRSLLGRIVDPLGRPIDGKGPIRSDGSRLVDAPAPGLVDRQPVRVALRTGIKIIDSLTPVGRGQRQLIIGDRRTGKTTLATDTIINQGREGVICIYVAIGQKESTVAGLVDHLREHGALDHSVVVVATAAAPAALRFLAPYVGTAIAEFFMHNTWDCSPDRRPHLAQGLPVAKPVAEGGLGLATMVVFDDLSRHAIAYREMSLLLRRLPGREAYPGDMFYQHSRLLERAGRLHDRLGGGSLTALPIIETQRGELSAYIPTNVISITDGQVYLQSELFHQGQRPAVHSSLSVSRVGTKSQDPAMQRVAGALRRDLAAYRDIRSFADLGSEIDRFTRRALDRGERLQEILKQGPGAPLAFGEEVALLMGASQGMLDAVPLDAVAAFEVLFLQMLRDEYSELILAVAAAAPLDRETSDRFTDLIARSRRQFATAHNLDLEG